jgi:hypothetical protein
VKEAPDPEPLTPEQLSALLETLRKIAKEATDEPLDMELLRREIEDAVQWHRVDPWVEAEIEKMNFHEIVEPARTILAILSNDDNSGLVSAALAGDDFFKGIRRRDALIADLEKLAAHAQKLPPRKNPANRPAGIDLRLLVGHLANTWLVLTNTPFTSEWRKTDPMSFGAQFVYEFVKVVDPVSLPSLPTATRWVVNKRLRGKLPGYFGSASRKHAI